MVTNPVLDPDFLVSVQGLMGAGPRTKVNEGGQAEPRATWL